MAFFTAVPQEGRDIYGNPVKKLDKHGKQIWSKSVDTNSFGKGKVIHKSKGFDKTNALHKAMTKKR